MEFRHKSVMLNECINGLNINPNGVYVDCTLGGGGHSLEICKHLTAKGTLIGIDQDTNAIEKATQVLSKYSERTILVKGSFFNIKNILNSLSIEKVDGILADLGVSSHQLDEPSRGFSYMHDAPLDMRMDNSKNFSAYELINNYSEDELYRVIRDYGEERWAKRIAQFIVSERKNKEILTTFDLVSVIKKAMPKAVRSDGPHPAKRTFQAIRIEVNSELEPLNQTINNMVECLNSNGRICIITFHSLEDRIVKSAFKNLISPCTCPHDLPFCACGKSPSLNLITRKPLIPSDAELEENPRARSAKLRIAEKV